MVEWLIFYFKVILFYCKSVFFLYIGFEKKIFKGSIIRCWEYLVNNLIFIFKMLIYIILVWCLICNIGYKDCKLVVKLIWIECLSVFLFVVC